MGNLVGKEDESSGRKSSSTRRQVETRKVEGTSAAKERHSTSNEHIYPVAGKAERGERKVDNKAVDKTVVEHREQSGFKEEEEEDSKEELKDTGDMMDELVNDDHIPMVFRWDGGGKNVYITGTFNKWSEKIPMRRSGNDFLYIRELKRGRHAYKFIVDDEWRFAPDQPTVADPHGYINNFIDLTNFERSFGVDTKPLNSQEYLKDDNLYGNFCPDPEDPQWYAKEPPPLPPHLRHIILNTPQSNDCLAAKAMQVPQRVTLNHLYCSAIKENLMVLGVTQRYREKFVTTVFYSPLPDANQVGRTAAQSPKQLPRTPPSQPH